MDRANTSLEGRKITFPESEGAHGLDRGDVVVVRLKREDAKLEPHLDGLGRGHGVALLDGEVEANVRNI